MNLTEAKTAARQRGETMRRSISSKPFAHTASDIADIVEAVLSKSHPLESMPQDGVAFGKWRKEQDIIRGQIWDSFAEGVNSTALSPAAALGSMTSEAKAAAARRNGRKGGRPRKQQ